jgi:hypothetical protein
MTDKQAREALICWGLAVAPVLAFLCAALIKNGA